MKSILCNITEARQGEGNEKEPPGTGVHIQGPANDRRNFLKKTALGGVAPGGLIHLSVEDTIALTTQGVPRAPAPSDLKITDLRVAQKGAEEAGIPMAMHHNSSPVAFMANIHCAAATENALVLEFHGGDMLKDREELVIKTDGRPLMEKGFGLVPLTAPGLGIELNDEKLKARMPKDAKYFEATPEWDSPGRTYDKLWI